MSIRAISRLGGAVLAKVSPSDFRFLRAGATAAVGRTSSGRSAAGEAAFLRSFLSSPPVSKPAKSPFFRDRSARVLPNQARSEPPRTRSGLKGFEAKLRSKGHLEWYHSGRFAAFPARREHGRDLRSRSGAAIIRNLSHSGRLRRRALGGSTLGKSK